MEEWPVIESYFRDTPFFLTRHQFDGYHDFIFEKIPYIIKKLNKELLVLKYAEDKTTLKHEIRPYIGGINGDKIYYTKPTIIDEGVTRPLFPNEARLKDLNYSMDLYVDVDIEYKSYSPASRIVRELKKVLIGQIPIMIRSRMCALDNQPDNILSELGECPYDQGGYFIAGGNEKVIIAQERGSTNRIFFNRSDANDFAWSGFMRCTSRENTLFPKKFGVGIYGADYDKGRRRNAIAVTCDKILIGEKLFNIPLCIMFRALGIESDIEIIRHVVPDYENPLNAVIVNMLRSSIIDPENHQTIYSQKAAIEYLTNFVRFKDPQMTMHIITEEFLPNVGRNFSDKALMLGHIINTIIRISLGLLPEANRDNFANKRVDTTGFLLANLFRDFYNEFRNHVRSTIDRFYNQNLGNWGRSGSVADLVNTENYRQIFRDDFISVGFSKSLRSRWGISVDPKRQIPDPSKQGITQDLNRLSYIGYVSHIRRVCTPIDDTLKIRGPRKLPTASWGYMCPVETPDGSGIGIIKHLSMLTHTTLGTDPEVIEEFLLQKGAIPLSDLDKQQRASYCKVLIDNVWFAMHDDPQTLTTELKEARRAGKLNRYIGISWVILENQVHIRTESGRMTRPLYIVKDGKRAIQRNAKWNELIEKNVIEYIDVEEADTILVAMRPEDLSDKMKHYTHCEIDPSTIFSAYSSSIPFIQHIPGPRTILSAAQVKQAIGIYSTNFNNRMDTVSYILHYPQKPLVNTKYMGAFNLDALPYGENCIVAVATYSGYNMEDALIINKSSMDRGMFNTTVMKSVAFKEEEGRGVRIMFGVPENESMPKFYGNDGLPIENTYIKEGYPYVGMIKTIKGNTEDDPDVLKNVSKYADKTYYGTIDKVFSYKGEYAGLKNAKIRFRKFRIPEIGDKVASRYAIKGVCGMILPQEDMPFTADGLVPDIIVNPHSFPTRMSMGQLMECLMAKACCVSGSRLDGTAFNNVNIDSVSDILEDVGLNRHGDELMYNGYTGEQIPMHIFIGPTYYCRLKHMVADKMQYRSGNGPTSKATHQPVKGRSRGGGLRIGEMETNVLLAHGLGSFTQETMMKKSDDFEIKIDDKSGNMAITNSREGYAYATRTVSADNRSRIDVSSDGVTRVAVPFCFKMMLQEIEGLNVTAKLITSATPEQKQLGEIDEDDVDSVEEWVPDDISDAGSEASVRETDY